MRQKLPFGIAQIGKSFRNEITPGNYIFRTREFEQMEMQYFVKPDKADTYFEEIKQKRMAFYIKLGFKKENLRFKDHEHLAHYCKKGCDIEYHFPFGWQEIEGIHNRTDFDLTQHSQYSKKDLQYFDEDEKKSYIPYVIEASSGCDRVLLAVLYDSLEEENFSFPYALAPYQIAVLPLVKNKENIVKKAKQVLNTLNENHMVTYDESGSIGRRYARQDEIGTPYAVTIDFQSLKNNTVTVRNRDTKQQSRVKINNLNNYFSNNKKSSFIQKIYKILCKK
jgi:glycyl-tRNA synthetase